MSEEEIKEYKYYLRDWYLRIKNGRDIENAYSWLRAYIS